uniref:Uncharacterized protein n=1 Tax=Knipowitschia caucasica TaxID=637954 RepID=A0AAV2JW51_KNICA
MKHRAQHPRAATVLLHPHRADRGLVKNRHRQFGHGAGRAQRLVWPEEMTNDYLELKSLGGSLSEASLSAVWTLAAGTGESQKQKRPYATSKPVQNPDHQGPESRLATWKNRSHALAMGTGGVGGATC